MSLKPWREIAQPHKDVLEGSFKQSEFAADISQVANGNAPSEYQDAEQFYARTFITEGMRLLLISVAQRLAGKGGDPVVQLQTAFGGGKTHSMLAVYHLASRKVSTDKLLGIPTILDAAKLSDLPKAKVAVIDGISRSPSQPIERGLLKINTLWGELAYQLLNEEGYSLVAESDKDGTSPGKEVLIDLLRKSSPCVVLVDELVSFIRQLEPGKSYKAGTFESNMSFIQALTEALKSVPNAMMLASLPESEVEAAGDMGQRALTTLEKYFGRVDLIWKPVEKNESFEIVRRRLFENAGDPGLIDKVCKEFSRFYQDNKDKFPLDCQSAGYLDSLRQSYPIHPEVFDRLYEDWSTLEKFQRTRGVLQYMAVVIHRLWESGNKDALIMPGSIPLDDSNVKTISTRYLPQGWDPVIDKEIDGEHSLPVEIENKDPRFGAINAARRLTRTIFLATAPSQSMQNVRGVKIEDLLLGAVQPGQVPGTFEDAMKRLRDGATYLFSDADRYWFDTRPNLRREMESRKQNINERDILIPEIKSRVTRLFGSNHHFSGIHVFTASADIPDEYGTGPRLVVLPLTAGYSRTDTTQTVKSAEEILRKRGDQPRQKQNRLIFLAPDFDVISRLKDTVRTYIAWSTIVDDIKLGSLSQDMAHLKQAEQNRDNTDRSISQLLREAFKWLIAPREEFTKDKFTLHWDAIAISSGAQNLVQEIETKLKEEEWLIYEWSPIHLKNTLDRWYFKDTKEVGANKVWQDFCHYLYLPRLVNDKVFSNAIQTGVNSVDFFGYASGKEADKYLGFAFGTGYFTPLDTSCLLIDKSTAQVYADEVKRNTPVIPETPLPPVGGPDTQPKQPLPDRVGVATKKIFYGTLKLDKVQAKAQFANVVDEVIQQFVSKYGVDVVISVEINAKSPSGFDDGFQRTIKENCNVLKFGSAEFED